MSQNNGGHSQPRRARMVAPWVRRRRILLAAAVIVLVLPCIILVSAKYVAVRQLDAYMAAIRAEGLPATIEELVRWQETRSQDDAQEEPSAQQAPGGTAMECYQQAAESLRQADKQPVTDDLESILVLFNKEGSLSTEDLDRLKTALSAISDELELLHQAADLPPGEYALNYARGLNMELPHLAGIRNNVRVLRAEAIHEALMKEPDRVYEALTAAMAILRPLRKEPVLISQLVRVACNGIIFDTWRDVLTRVSFKEEQLVRLQEWFADSDIPDAFSAALISERVFGTMEYRNPASLATRDEEWKPDEYAAQFLEAASALGLFIPDQRRYYTGMKKLIAAMELPYPEAKALCVEVVSQLKSPSLPEPPPGAKRHRHHRPRAFLPRLSKQLISYSRLPDAAARDRARSTLGRTAAAIERYHLSQGRIPEGLDELVPNFLESIPEDPFDLQPVRYRLQQTGYLLYCIGINGVDDNGVQGELIGEGDLTFPVRR